MKILSLDTWRPSPVDIKEATAKFLQLSGNAFWFLDLLYCNIYLGKTCSSRKVYKLIYTTVGKTTNTLNFMFENPKHTKLLKWNERRMSLWFSLTWFTLSLAPFCENNCSSVMTGKWFVISRPYASEFSQKLKKMKWKTSKHFHFSSSSLYLF